MSKTGVLGRAEFLEVMNGLQRQFDEASAYVKSRECKFDHDLKQLTDFLRNEPLEPESLRSGGSLESSLTLDLENIRKILDWAVIEWTEKVAKYERNTEFREDHGDSLLVYVYGLVNTGKSSLGNFVAHGRHDPDDEFISMLSADSTAPEFFVRSVASGKQDDIEKAHSKIGQIRRFHTNYEEATNRIQGFKLPGLTWIDSPGLGSVSKANGKLASEYVDSADLVLVTMNSAQPGRRSEVAELRKLMGRGKPVMVLITRADEIEVDEDEDGKLVKKLTMKSDRDRRDMVEWVKSQFENLTEDGVGKPEIVTISVHYAEKHHDPAGANESGVSELFSRLREIAGGRGVAIKNKTPNKNLHTFISEVAGEDEKFGAGRIIIPLVKFRRNLVKIHEDLEKRMRQAGADAEREVEKMIDEKVEKLRKRWNDLPERADEELEKLKRRDSKKFHNYVNRQFNKIVDLHVHEEAKKVARNIDMEIRSLHPQKHEFKAVFELVSRTVRKHSWWTTITGGVVGGAVGFVAAGPAGSAIGAGAGAAAGKAIYGKRNKTIVEPLKTGDNAEYVALASKDHYRRVLQEITNIIIQRLSEDILEPMSVRTDNVIERINWFRVAWSVDAVRQEKEQENS